MGAHVLVAGAGLAGLAAARELEDRGHRATVIEARDRVGGRLWTYRDGLAAGQHAEAGADIIESEQHAVLALARRFGLRYTPILTRGFGYYGPNRAGQLRRQSMSAGSRDIQVPLNELIRDYKLAEQRWDGAVAQRLSRASVTDWVRALGRRRRIRHPRFILERLRSFRGLFLADPEQLSLLAFVDFFAGDPFGGDGQMFRITGGNDTLASAIAASLRHPPLLNSMLRRIRARPRGIMATVESALGEHRTAQIRADFAIVTLPPPPLRDVRFEPRLPNLQMEAIRNARMGAATRLVLQFEKPFWRRRNLPSLFGTTEAIGAVWDGNEATRTGPAILTCLAGGGASGDLQNLLRREGAEGAVSRLAWLGRPTRLLHSKVTTWESDPWSGGGYLVFGPEDDPNWREALARPAGRIAFAGEHTSLKWQGYLNGAVLSGQRAAAEIDAMTQVASGAGRSG